MSKGQTVTRWPPTLPEAAGLPVHAECHKQDKVSYI